MSRLRNLFFLIYFLLSFPATLLLAQDIETYLEGYDPNTEITIRGELAQLYIPERGAVFIHLFIKGKIYKVYLAPVWYFRQLNSDLALRDELEIVGAKVYTPRYGLIFVAKSLRNVRTGQELHFRSPSFEPHWRRGGPRKGNPFK